MTPQMRILVLVEPQDFRKGIDGLARACRDVLSVDPFSGRVVVFRNRRQAAVRLLCYDGQGFWLAHTRLERGTFAWPHEPPGPSLLITNRELAVLLAGVDVAQARMRRWYELARFAMVAAWPTRAQQTSRIWRKPGR